MHTVTTLLKLMVLHKLMFLMGQTVPCGRCGTPCKWPNQYCVDCRVAISKGASPGGGSSGGSGGSSSGGSSSDDEGGCLTSLLEPAAVAIALGMLLHKLWRSR